MHPPGLAPNVDWERVAKETEGWWNENSERQDQTA
jgi:hypothetical protein